MMMHRPCRLHTADWRTYCTRRLRMKLGSTSFAVLYKARIAFLWTFGVLVATRCKLEHAAILLRILWDPALVLAYHSCACACACVRACVCVCVFVTFCRFCILQASVFCKVVLFCSSLIVVLFLRRTTVFSHAQTTVICQECNSLLCQPTGGKARLTDGCSFRPKTN